MTRSSLYSLPTVKRLAEMQEAVASMIQTLFAVSALPALAENTMRSIVVHECPVASKRVAVLHYLPPFLKDVISAS